MSNFPNFTLHGYQVISELGRNREGGRITWLATHLDTKKQVVLKQFCFAQAGSDWSAYNAYEREIQVLQGLNHPGIPRYLGGFDTPDGFCLIQEYKNALSLANNRSFEPEEIKKIAIEALEILVYLQNRIPPVIHRDLKPENILVDDRLNVYLIDFGFARIGSQEVSGSSVFRGTPGFIPPEQLRQPTEASDLYGLGATLICLLTGIKSTAIQDLTDNDEPYLIQFQERVPKLSLRFIQWLEKMVQPKLKARFVHAESALEALKPLYVIRIPEAHFDRTVIEFTATRLGKKIAQTITVSNPIPETILEGRWEVVPHPSDPPHTPDNHTWISFEPANFAHNEVECQVLVDTGKLLADKSYKRQILLHTNCTPETYYFNLELQTAPLPIVKQKLPYSSLNTLLVISGIVGFLGGNLPAILEALSELVGEAIGPPIGPMVSSSAYLRDLIWGISFGFLIGSLSKPILKSVVKNVIWFVIGWFIIYSVIVPIFIGISNGYVTSIIVRVIVKSMVRDTVLTTGCLFGSMIAYLSKKTARSLSGKKISKVLIFWLMLLTAGLGISLGGFLATGWLNQFVILALAGTSLPLAIMLVYPTLKRHRLIAQYRKSEQHLIKP
ncbi:MAG: serine/threonine protein kinase [Cyanosarcina radialis HA8281-LM2]|jgi:serine/threonine protein kinase/heme exporter protein D|nr:serine/threonine protein kinase [Cyanosarcina radialis HA8281-LM2]